MDELYIPGDLVFHYIPKTTIKKYVKVYVCSTNNALSLEDMDGHLYDYIGLLYPIPLTPEILKKNGWNEDCKWYKLTTKRACLYITKDTKSIDLLCEIFNDENKNEIRQNFLALDLKNSFSLLLDGEKKEIISQAIDRSDLNSLLKLNKTIFNDTVQLRIESLLK